MIEVWLKFPNLKSLWEFEVSHSGLPYQLDLTEKLLKRVSSWEQIDESIEIYHATLLLIRNLPL